MAARKTPAEKAADSAREVQAKIESFPEPFREMSHRVHQIIQHSNPDLQPRIWYGMPGYALAASQPVLVFFRLDDGVFTLGLTEKANIAVPPEAGDRLVGGSWYLDSLDEPTEERIAQIVWRATAAAE